MYDVVFKKQAEKHFRKMYHILTKDHQEVYYKDKLHGLVELYCKYRGKNRNLNSETDSVVFALAESIDNLIDHYNYVSKYDNNV
jgi:hypothetical protein